MNPNLFNTTIKGVYKFNLSKFDDSRGSFKNIFRQSDEFFIEIWGDRKISQVNLSNTLKKGSIRGLHFQKKPCEEAKLITCIQGKVFDVAVDLRENSATYLKSFFLELSPNNNQAIFIPEGCAHGFQSLEDNSKLIYLHSNNWERDFEVGYRWDDPTINIPWPLEPSIISKKDQNLPYLKNDE